MASTFQLFQNAPLADPTAATLLDTMITLSLESREHRIEEAVRAAGIRRLTDTCARATDARVARRQNCESALAVLEAPSVQNIETLRVAECVEHRLMRHALSVRLGLIHGIPQPHRRPSVGECHSGIPRMG